MKLQGQESRGGGGGRDKRRNKHHEMTRESLALRGLGQPRQRGTVMKYLSVYLDSEPQPSD